MRRKTGSYSRIEFQEHDQGRVIRMVNQLAIRTLLTQPPCRVLVDSRADVAAHFEEGGLGMSGISIQTVQPSNARYLVLEDIVSRILITNDVHKKPTRVISIENTAGGSVVPLAELRRIREWAGRNRVVVHMDGARLWEAVAAGRGGLRDYCTLCDLASLDFSRNLGAPMRAMVLGSAQLIARLRRIRKSIGGALRQSGPLAAAAQFAFMEQIGLGPWESRGKLRAVHLLAKQVGQMWVDLGELLREVETNLVWVDLDKADITVDRWNELGRKYGANWRGRELFYIIRSRLILSISSVLYLRKP